jgi:hypothetical protein
MADLASIVGAGAAAVAATLAGTNLFLSERREQSKWVREALIEAYVAFLQASFELGKVTRQLRSARPADRIAEVRGLEKRAGRLHEQQTEVLTRLRLLALPMIIRAAEDLDENDHAVTDLALAAVPADETDWADARRRRQLARGRARRAGAAVNAAA